MTLAEHFTEKGRLEGEQKGRIETKKEDALRMLDSGAELDFIHKVTGLAIEEIEQLQK